MKSILIKDTTKEEREEIIRSSLDCGCVTAQDYFALRFIRVN